LHKTSPNTTYKKKKLPTNTNTWGGQEIFKHGMHEENWEQQNQHIARE
jgi:hypothetical protein